MPEDITYVFHVAQGKHTACDHCGKTFTFLLRDVCVGTGVGSLLGDANKVKAKALEDLGKDIDKVARSRIRGFATCPHCGVYQRFMIKAKTWAHRMKFLTVGTVVGTIPILIFALIKGEGRGLTILGMILAAASGAMMTTGLIGWILSYFFPVRIDPHPGPDPGSMSDEEFLQWIDECEADDADPILAWADSIDPVEDDDNDKNFLLSLGVFDMTGRSFCSEKYNAETAIAEVKRDLEDTVRLQEES